MMQQPGGPPDAPTAPVPNAAQMSREAKHMRVMLMLCVKEKVLDQSVLESIFSQFLQCEQQGENPEETEAAFRRIVGRTYGPKSKEYLNAIDRAKLKLEQLKERKNKGELTGGNPLGMSAPPTAFPVHPQSMTHPMASNPISAPSMQHHPQQMGMQNNPQYFNPHIAPRPVMGGQALPHIQPVMPNQLGYKPHIQHIGGQPGLQPQLHPQHIPGQQHLHQPHLPLSQQPPLPHSQSAPSISSQQLQYDNRNPNMPIAQVQSQTVSADPQKYSYSSTPVPDLDDIKQEDAKKRASKKKGDESEKIDDGKKKKAAESKKGKGGKGDSEPRLSMPIGGMPSQESRPAGYPSSVSDELDTITERPNLMQEGLQTTDKGIMTGYIVDGMMLSREEQQSRQMMRENILLNSNNYDSMDSLGLEIEPFMESNVIGKDILETVTRKVLSSQMELGSSARKLLSDGIQSHLKTIMEGAIEISRKRLNRSAYGNYQELFQQLKQNDGNISQMHLSNVALKWGPDIRKILIEEELRLNQFYQDYHEIDEEKLKDKMKHFDEERIRLVGTKRKFGLTSSGYDMEAPLNWWEKDISLEEEGLLSYEEIAEVWRKNDIAAKYELGPFVKKKSQKKVEGGQGQAQGQGVTDDGSDMNKANPLGQNSSIPVENTTSAEDDNVWKDQSCPITLPTQCLVMPEDIQQIISKRNGFTGTRFDRDATRKSKFQWRLSSR